MIKVGGEPEQRLYRILAEGMWAIENVACQYRPEAYSPEFTQVEQWEIDRCWRARRAEAAPSGSLVYDSYLIGLHDVAVTTTNGISELHLLLGDTDYRAYVATRGETLARPLTRRTNPLGTCIIPVTSEGFVVLARRSLSADVNPGKYFTFGGYFDRALDFEGDRQPSIGRCLMRELEEETSLAVSQDAFSCLGIVYDLVHCHPEFIALLQINRSREELATSIPISSDAEFSGLTFVHSSVVAGFLDKQAPETTASLVGGLRMYSRLLSSGLIPA